jgi:hypothetical protein
MTITKRREGDRWRVYVDGVRSALTIEKGAPPRYREPQEYDVCHDDGDFLFAAKSVARAETILGLILTRASTPASV